MNWLSVRQSERRSRDCTRQKTIVASDVSVSEPGITELPPAENNKSLYSGEEVTDDSVSDLVRRNMADAYIIMKVR